MPRVFRLILLALRPSLRLELLPKPVAGEVTETSIIGGFSV